MPNNPVSDAYQLLSRADYFADLIARLDKCGAGDRVVVATMAMVVREDAVGQLLASMAGAAKRGAEVRLIVDAFTFMIDYASNKFGPLFFSDSLERPTRGPFAAAREELKQLAEAGAKYVIINPPSRSLTNPFAGRSHMKFACLNDRVYVGGCNLDVGVQLDVMVEWTDRRVSGMLQGVTDKLFAARHVRPALGEEDYEYQVNDDADLVFDVGVAGRSLIFERALALIDEAKEHILLTCQYYPNDVTTKHLLAAYNRGVKVKVVYNHPSRHPGAYKFLHHGVLAAMRLSLPASFFEHVVKTDGAFLHAKVIATESAAMIGSHNYVTAGIKLGTAELALEVRDADFARRAEALVWDMVA